MRPCDSKQLEAYLNGALSESEMAAFEAHALGCDACSRALESQLEDTRKRAAKATLQEEVPPSVAGRVRAIGANRKRSRLGWFAYPAVAATSALLLFLLAKGGAASRVDDFSGKLLVNGHEIHQGDSIPLGSRVTTIGRCEVRFGDYWVLSPGAWNEFQLDRGGDMWELLEPAAPLLPVHRGAKPMFAIQMGGHLFEGLGTRFMVAPARGDEPILQVYESAVRVGSDGNSKIVHAGEQLAEGRVEPLESDPTANFSRPVNLIPKLKQALIDSDGPAPFPRLPQETVAELVSAEQEIARDTTAASPYIRIALALARAEERESASRAIQRAVSLDLGLTAATSEQLWELVRSQTGLNGSPHVARVLLGHLLIRGEIDASVRWSLLLPSDPADPMVQIAAAKAILAERDPKDVVSVCAVLIQAANALANDETVRRRDLDSLRLAAELLKNYIGVHGRALSPRRLARAYACLSEAEYFVPETEIKSLDALRQSVRLWPTPTQRIHLATRLAETTKADPGDLRTVAECFLADPTFYASERVLKYLLVTACGREDLAAIGQFARWMGNTFRTVADAQAQAAQALMSIDLEEAKPYMERAIALRGGVHRLPEAQATSWAQIRWRLEIRSGGTTDIQRARNIAQECGLFDGKLFSTSAVGFYQEVGDTESALRALKSSNYAPNVHMHVKARILRDGGRTEEAVRAIEAYLAFEGERDPLDVADAQVSLAELFLSNRPARARELAQSFLDQKHTDLNRAWRGVRRYRLWFEARAQMVLGHRDQAVRSLREYLDTWGWDPDRSTKERRLDEWERGNTGL